MADYGEETRTPAIPSVGSSTPEQVLQAVKEWIEVRQGARGDGLDRAVTLRDLLNAGLATPESLRALPSAPEAILPPPGVAEPAVPPTPTGLTAAGAVNTIMVTWEFARGYSRLSHFEVWRGETDTLSGAVKIAQVYEPMYSDVVGPSATYFYWVRAVSDAGTSPFNAQQGVEGRTAMNVEEVHEAIQEDIDASGLLDQLTLKTSPDGFVSGYGLASTPSGDNGSATAFAVLANRFLVAGPASDGVAPSSPFVVQATPAVVNGVLVPKGVYMSEAFIMNGVITNAKIGSLAVDDAKIASVNVSKITAGQLSVGTFVESSNFLSGQSGFQLHANGNAEFNNATMRGAVYASAGRIGDNIIDATGIQSVGFNNEDAGWRIDSSGTVHFNQGTFRGNIYAVDGEFAGALQAATGTFKGALQAATGTFTGQVKGGSIAVGDYSSYTWPPAGKTGAYLGPEGLLMGNANDGKYFQVSADGNIYMPGMQVVNGAMTINAVNVIDTLQISGNAVSASIGFSGSGSFAVYSAVPATILVVVTQNPRPGPVNWDQPWAGWSNNPSGTFLNGAAVAYSYPFGAVTGSSGGDSSTMYYTTFGTTGVGIRSLPAGYSTFVYGMYTSVGPAAAAVTGILFIMKR